MLILQVTICSVSIVVPLHLTVNSLVISRLHWMFSLHCPVPLSVLSPLSSSIVCSVSNVYLHCLFCYLYLFYSVSIVCFHCMFPPHCLSPLYFCSKLIFCVLCRFFLSIVQFHYPSPMPVTCSMSIFTVFSISFI